MKENNWLIPLALFMFAFSMGMDLHHTRAIESVETSQVQPQTDERTKTYEVQVVWVRNATIGGGAFPSFPDTDYDTATGIIKSRTRPDSAIVARQAAPPAPGYTLHRVVAVRQLK